jgi:carboxylate-amine ligase
MKEIDKHPRVAMGAEDSGRDDDAHPLGVSQALPIQTDGDSLRALLDGDGPLTVGLEEELMLLDPETLDLAPVAPAVIAAAGGVVKGELPLAQVEVVSAPSATVGEAVRDLSIARAIVAQACSGLAIPAAGAVHPFAGPEGELSGAELYRWAREEYGPVARLQLVFGLHVHVRVSGAVRALAVYNAMRSYLPEIAALAANAPFYAGRDTGMASVRPKISELLPRQGVPPAFASLDELSEALAWEERSGAMPHPRHWWWELRLHPRYGTLEVRVPDQQTTVAETAAVAAFAKSIVVWLAARHDDGEDLPVHPTWRIEENRWSAARHGLTGSLADLDTAARRPTRERVLELLDELAPQAERIGCAAELQAAESLARRGGAERLREAAQGDARRAASYMAERFLDEE